MVRRSLAFLFIIFAGLLFLPASAYSAPLRVAITGQEPFVQNQNGVWTGLAVSLWEEIAAQNQWAFEYHPYPSIEGAVTAVGKGEADVLVGNTTVTSARIKTVEFSQPYFRSGLQIMIPEARPHTFARLWENIADFGHLTVFWYILGIVLLVTILVTLFERKHNPDFPKTWPAGLAEAFYYVISLTLTNKSAYKGFAGVLGRLMLVFWMVLGFLMVTYVTAAVTAAMTVEQLRTRINGPQDLYGRRVGAITDSAGAVFLKNRGITFKAYPNLEEAVAALIPESGSPKIDCIVDDAPVLRAYDFNNPHAPITEVGPVFNGFTYAYALPLGSPLRIELNASLTRLIENGIWLRVLQQYLGEEYQP